jgi:hypothetical protein
VAATSVVCFVHTRKILMNNATFDQELRIDLLSRLKRQIPEFPPKARVLILEDPWGPDWGPFFLTQLMYHDSTLWVDRVKNSTQTGDRDSYDLLLVYKPPRLDAKPTRLFGVRRNWETHWVPAREGEITLMAPNEAHAIRKMDFAPGVARAGQAVTVTVPGLANVKIDVIYRVLSHEKTTTHTAENWCTLDAQGTCTISAPPAGRMATLTVDWVRASKQRWIFTRGVLTVSG